MYVCLFIIFFNFFFFNSGLGLLAVIYLKENGYYLTRTTGGPVNPHVNPRLLLVYNCHCRQTGRDEHFSLHCLFI